VVGHSVTVVVQADEQTESRFQIISLYSQNIKHGNRQTGANTN